ncbi:hypothetical protein CWS35_24690 [Bradyrhizobium sp. SK17]|nr:PEPxxWA-CTERM sorting domain-containing protein [Bradyrhizobium sp. SK17]AUC97085.1 hypothetical protein CWS35_24690 [Bradyrhizobium sp. SK17]
MRKLVFALGLFFVVLTPNAARSGTFEWTGTNTLVVGDFSAYPNGFLASYSWTGGPYFTQNVPVDPFNGPFSSISLSFYFNGSTTLIYECDQFEAHCGRNDMVQTYFYINPEFPNISGGGGGGGDGPNVAYAPLQIFIELPSGFSLIDPNAVASAVPEPSTWAMMLLGFAGLGLMAYRRSKTLMAAA